MDTSVSFFLILGCFFLTFLLVPKIIGVAQYKKLVDKPNQRSSHEIQTPRLGGVAFYITIMMALYFMEQQDTYNLTNSLIPCLTILFIIGLKDDLVVLSAKVKFFAQLLTAAFLLFDSNMHVLDLHGFIGIDHIPFVLTIALTCLIIAGIINSINLVDGLDGLAAGLVLSSTIAFALIFLFTGYYFSFLLTISAIGCILGFLPYNLSQKKKIFMGDTGSMLMGFLLAFMTIRVLSMDVSSLKNIGIPLENVPILLVFILFIPVMDALRVMLFRTLAKKNPFEPDRTHLHHLLIDRMNWTHLQTSAFITVLSVLISLVGYGLTIYFNSLLLFCLFACIFAGYSLFIHYFFVRKESRINA